MLIEGNTSYVFAEHNADAILPMASTTKIMTALVVLENTQLTDIVKVDKSAVGVEGSSMYIMNNEELTIEDLLYGLMLVSGNDAAVALACHVGGSIEGFVELMNERALEMGLLATHFVTPNGLHADGHHTTARELAIITVNAMRNEQFRKIVSTQYHTTQSGEHIRSLKNKNSLLWDYEGAVGVKTGYTMAAGRCLVFAAEKEGMLVIGVLLNCKPMFEEAASLFDYAFDNYALCNAIESGAAAARVYVAQGEKSILELVTKISIMTVVERGSDVRLNVQIEVAENIAAPIAMGDVLGKLRLYNGTQLIGETELIASECIGERDFTFWWNVLVNRFAG